MAGTTAATAIDVDDITCSLTGATVPVEKLNFAANLLGTRILTSNGTQCLIESNNTFIHFFQKHAINRNVDPEWVKMMKMEIVKMAHIGECMTLTLAIDERDVKLAMEDPEIDVEQGGFKAIILDGQHRWEAMMELHKDMPEMIYKVWLVVYLVRNDEEIDTRLMALNKRRNFSQDDTDKVQTTARFFQAFDEVIKPENSRRRCVQKVRKSEFINEPSFIKKHKDKSVQEFKDALHVVAQLHKTQWDVEKARNPKLKTNVIGVVIDTTNLYQMIDDSCRWLLML
jgi:hypothetical protein